MNVVDDSAPSVPFVFQQQMAFFRKNRNFSCRALSERCAEIGAESMTHAVLTNLELGRRGNPTVEEWLAIAAALDVPPMTLLLPTGWSKKVQLTPKSSLDIEDAFSWLTASPVGDRCPCCGAPAPAACPAPITCG